MTDSPDLTCGTCISFRVTDGKHGQCWRYPPTSLPMMTQAPGKIQHPIGQPDTRGVAVAAIRPPVQSDTLACGERDDGAPEGAETAGGTGEE